MMTFFDYELALLCLACVVLGVCVGVLIPRHTYKHTRRFEAPVPQELGYDPTNPINQRNQVKVGEMDENGFVRLS